MTNLEGFRLVNVHANNNTIIYPDEYFSIEGKNALIDMKNGGGKTLAAQMMFQTILPNSYFTDKNPIINLFHGVPSGSVIHCTANFKMEGHQYSSLCLGFAAIAEPKNSEDLPDAIDRVDLGLKYMNYIIAGNNLKADLLSADSLPLSQEIKGENVQTTNYKTLKDYLQTKSKSEKHGRHYEITIFENSKSPYYQELKKYGINAEVFEFLREINKDENYIKQFFEEKCKKPRDLLMNFIIPNTEKALDARAYSMNIEKVDKSSQLAESLYEKSQSLNELNKFQADKAEYEKLKSEIFAFINFVKTRETSLKVFDEHLRKFSGQVAAYTVEIKQVEDVLRQLEENKTEIEAKKEQIEKDLKNIEIRECEINLDELKRVFRIAEEKLLQVNNEISSLNKEKNKMDAINLCVDYKRFEVEKTGIDEKLEKLTNTYYNEKKSSAEYANSIYKLANDSINDLKKDLKDQQELLNIKKEKDKQLRADSGSLVTKLEHNSKYIDQLNKHKETLDDNVRNIQRELTTFPSYSGSLFDDEELKEVLQRQKKNTEEIDNTNKLIEDNKENNHKLAIQREKNQLISEQTNRELNEKREWLGKYRNSLENVKLKVACDEKEIEITCNDKREQVALNIGKKKELQNKIAELEEEVKILQNYGFLRDKSKYDAANILKGEWQYAEFGSDILKELEEEKVNAILEQFPGFAEVLVVSDQDYNRVANGKKSMQVAVAKENFILMPRSIINKIETTTFENLYLMTRNGEHYKKLLDSGEAIAYRQEEIHKNNEKINRLEEEKEVLESQINILQEHRHLYPSISITEKNEECIRLETSLSELRAKMIRLEQQIKTQELEIDRLSNNKTALEEERDTLGEKKELLEEKIKLTSEQKNVQQQLIDLSEERKQLENDFNNNKADLDLCDAEINKIDKEIERTKQGLSDYQKYIESVERYKDSEYGLIDNEDISLLFERFEIARKQFDEKALNYGQLTEQQNKLEKRLSEIRENHNFKEFSFEDIYRLNHVQKISPLEFETLAKKLKELEEIRKLYNGQRNDAEADLKLGQKEYDKVKDYIAVHYSNFEILDKHQLMELKDLNNKELEKAITNLSSIRDKIKIKSDESIILTSEIDKYKVFCNTNKLEWKNAVQETNSIPFDTMYETFESLKSEYEQSINRINTEIKKLESTVSKLTINEQLKQKLKEYLINKGSYSEAMTLIGVLDQTSKSIDVTIENIEISINNIGKLDEEIASQVYRMLKTILDEVTKIPEYSKFKYGDVIKDSFRINISEENGCRIEQDIALARIKAYVYELASSVQNDGMNKKEIKNRLSINYIIQFGIEFDKLHIQILKIEQEKPQYYAWGRLSASSGQSYVTYVMFAITMIKYFNNVTLVSDKMKAPIFVFLDNPFASASAIELWEPVRRFLDKSNAQLLCVAHNVPSSAQILFDKHILVEQTKNSSGQFINTIRNEKSEAKQIIQMNVFDHINIE